MKKIFILITDVTNHKQLISQTMEIEDNQTVEGIKIKKGGQKIDKDNRGKEQTEG